MSKYSTICCVIDVICNTEKTSAINNLHSYQIPIPFDSNIRNHSETFTLDEMNVELTPWIR